MIRILKRLLNFSGNQRKNLILSFLYSFIDSIFTVVPIIAILTVLMTVIDKTNEIKSYEIVWRSFFIMLISVLGMSIFTYLSAKKRTLASFDMCAAKRIEIGEKLQTAPMGYFNENKIGDITATITTTLNDIELNSVMVFDKVINGVINAIVINIWLYFYEWHIGVITSIGLLISFFVYSLIQKKAKALSPKRQAAQANLVKTFLEFVQGIAVVKSFGLDEKSGKKVDRAIKESAKANTKLEKVFSTLTGVYLSAFKIIASIILVIVPYLLSKGDISLEKCILLLISSFVIYSKVELAGSVSSIARVVDASLDRMELVLQIPKLDEGAKENKPSNYDIEVRDVSFSYENRKVISNMNMIIPEKTSCAIVGPSGSGKTTICRLIARFWDVDNGQILIGGENIKSFKYKNLMDFFSIVFQNVYLFEDTIENNIKFGNEKASREEVVQVSKKALCHEFIMKLPNGYDTVLSESGASLSGGEKQRISIARSLLKNAPIVILDEATASIDPENERELQKAIAELMKDKTVIMIAHRLNTVKNADQIVVFNEGKICDRGKHEELIAKEGLYKNFVELKNKSIGWRLNR